MWLLINSAQNNCHYPFYILEHFIVPEAQRNKPCLFEKSRPFVVVCDCIKVLAAIKLNNDLSLQTNEVGHKITKMMLAAEFAALNLAAAQILPELYFRIGRIVA
jgi:hypothetical protein